MNDKKNNIRSFRYSDRVAEILESMEGDSLNAKFENLVLTCYDALPKVQSELALYKGLVCDERAKYWQLYRERGRVAHIQKLICELESNLSDVTQLTAGSGVDPVFPVE